MEERIKDTEYILNFAHAFLEPYSAREVAILKNQLAIMNALALLVRDMDRRREFPNG